MNERVRQIIEFIENLEVNHELEPMSIRGENDDLTEVMRHLNQYLSRCQKCRTSSENTKDELEASRIALNEAQKLAHLGNWNLDLKTNTLTWSDEIYRIFGLQPQEFEANYEAFLGTIHPEDLDYVNTAYTASVEKDIPYDIIHRIIRKDGEVRFVHERAQHDKDENGNIIRSIGTVQDVTKTVIAEKEIRKSLHEKEILLKEIHHRVKNNLQIITSLMYLQSQNTSDEKSILLFKETIDRVKSMAMVHEQMYMNENLNNISVKDYIQKLVNQLVQSYYSSDITMDINIEELSLKIDQAVPCGLIINEILSNAFKYAFQDFPDNKEKIITVHFAKNGDKCRLTIADNGKGLPDDINIEETESLGMVLITTLSSQLDAELKIDNSNGTKYELTF